MDHFDAPLQLAQLATFTTQNNGLDKEPVATVVEEPAYNGLNFNLLKIDAFGDTFNE